MKFYIPIAIECPICKCWLASRRESYPTGKITHVMCDNPDCEMYRRKFKPPEMELEEIVARDTNEG